MLAAIGDVHGQYSALRKIIEELPSGCLPVVIGDIFDKGPNSREVLRLLQDTEHIRILGNHDRMAIDAHSSQTSRLRWLLSGGRFTLDSFGGRMPDEALEFLAGAQLWAEEEGMLFVHAGIRPGRALSEQTERDLTTIRHPFLLASETGFDTPIVFGHTPLLRPWVRPDRIGCDTGAGLGFSLTAIVLEGGRPIHEISVAIDD